jgi:hypothetical protein
MNYGWELEAYGLLVAGLLTVLWLLMRAARKRRPPG